MKNTENSYIYLFNCIDKDWMKDSHNLIIRLLNDRNIDALLFLEKYKNGSAYNLFNISFHIGFYKLEDILETNIKVSYENMILGASKARHYDFVEKIINHAIKAAENNGFDLYDLQTLDSKLRINAAIGAIINRDLDKVKKYLERSIDDYINLAELAIYCHYNDIFLYIIERCETTKYRKIRNANYYYDIDSSEEFIHEEIKLDYYKLALTAASCGNLESLLYILKKDDNVCERSEDIIKTAINNGYKSIAEQLA